MKKFLETVGLISLIFTGFVLGVVFCIVFAALTTKIGGIKEITALLLKLGRLFRI